MTRRALSLSLSVCLAAPAAAHGPAGGGEVHMSIGMTVADLARAIKEAAPTLKKLEPRMPEEIRGEGVEAAISDLEGMAQEFERDPEYVPPARAGDERLRDRRAPELGAAGGAIEQLKLTSAVGAEAPLSVGEENVVAFSQEGESVAKFDEAAVRREVQRIAAGKAAGGAQQAYAQLIMNAVLSDPGAAPTAEVGKVYKFIRDAVLNVPEGQERGAALPVVVNDPNPDRTPPGVIAYYMTGSPVIYVTRIFHGQSMMGKVMTLMHEGLHFADDQIFGPIERNQRYEGHIPTPVTLADGTQAVRPDDANASERLAYTDMAYGTARYGRANLRVPELERDQVASAL